MTVPTKHDQGDDLALIEESELDGGGVRIWRRDKLNDPSPTLESSRIITMAWGDRYIYDLLNVTIPALLAPGNLPAFAAQFKTELVIVTETRLFERIRRSPVILKVLEQCNIRLLPVDDLLSSWYGITLTYALIRGFADLGRTMVDTHLVFLNADFILADGSLRKLAEKIKQGERLIVSPSYCMNLETTIEKLRTAKDENTYSLSISPREMAALIIANRHNTVRAKTVNQQLFRIHRYDQFYWYVNDQTLLARQMPISVVYMRPERPLTEMSTFWDYGVISEYCPTIKPCVLGDSDDFLIAELRPANTFSELLHLGWPSTDEISADLSSFTTKDHRDYGRYCLVLHADEIPQNIDEEKKKLESFVGEIYEKLSPPINYRNHPFWTAAFPQFIAQHTELAQACRARELIKSSIRKRTDFSSRQRTILELRHKARELEIEYQKLGDEASSLTTKLRQLDNDRDNLNSLLRKAWSYRDERRRPLQSKIEDMERQLQIAKGEMNLEQANKDGLTDQVSDAPAQNDGSQDGSTFKQPIIERLNTLYEHFFGRMPYITRLHPYKLMLRHVQAALMRANQKKLTKILFVSSGGVMAQALMKTVAGDHLTITPLMAQLGLYENIWGQKFDLCFCELSFEDYKFSEIFQKLLPLMSNNGKVICFYHNAKGLLLDHWTFEFTKTLFPLSGTSRIFFTGSQISAFNMRLYAKMIQGLRVNFFGLLRVTCTLIFCALLSRVSAIIEKKQNPQKLPNHCTSMTIEINL